MQFSSCAVFRLLRRIRSLNGIIFKYSSQFYSYYLNSFIFINYNIQPLDEDFESKAKSHLLYKSRCPKPEILRTRFHYTPFCSCRLFHNSLSHRSCHRWTHSSCCSWRCDCHHQTTVWFLLLVFKTSDTAFIQRCSLSVCQLFRWSLAFDCPILKKVARDGGSQPWEALQRSIGKDFTSE